MDLWQYIYPGRIYLVTDPIAIVLRAWQDQYIDMGYFTGKFIVNALFQALYLIYGRPYDLAQ
jgi:hypothetical protein